GNIFQQREELQKLFTAYFERFPGARLELKIESIRLIGDALAVEEGTRFLSTKEQGKAQVRYITVRNKQPNGKWLIASVREFYDDPRPTPGERWMALEGLEGEGVSESDDAIVQISCRWRDDRNCVPGDFQVVRGGGNVMQSAKRIGWDPQRGKVRSWL